MHDLLVPILAEVDALFVPVRAPAAEFWSGICQLRWRYPTHGIYWHGEKTAKQLSRARERLASAGLLTLVTNGSDRTLGHKLTDRGEALARKAAGLQEMTGTLSELDGLRRLRDHDDSAPERSITRHASVWTREDVIAETTYDGMQGNDPASRERRRTLALLEDALLPALIRGWCFSASDAQGHVWYALADELAAGPMPGERLNLPAEPAGAPAWAERDAQYQAAFREATTRLRGLRRKDFPDPREIGSLPMSCSPTTNRYVRARDAGTPAGSVNGAAA